MFTNTLISNLRAWHSRGLVSRELNAMSDRQLVDIGITRSDIDAVVSGRLVRRGGYEARS